MIATATRTAVLAVLAVVLILSAGIAGPKFSSAAFTAQTANAASTVGAAVDWTPPAVSVQDPGVLRSTVSLTAVASDAETGIRQVVLAFQPAGATTWTTLCTAAVAPYSCSWDTRTVADGQYDVRAIATDNSGYSTTSALLRVTVANTITVELSVPGDVLTGSPTLTTTLQNAGPGAYAVRVEYAPTGATNWRTACTAPTPAPYTCSWPTPSSGDYDLRSVATLNGVTTYSPIISDVLVDNTAPSVTLVDPGSPLRGTVTLAANATDEHSGIARVVIQYQLNSAGAWMDACTISLSPYSCRFSTTALPTGTHAFRAIATDAAGFATTSATITRTVDNTVASVAVEDPGPYLSGTANLSATANSTGGVASVAIQFAPRGGATWTTVCTATVAPYTCAWDTRTVADGLYDLRAVLTDATGKQTISAVVTSRTIDNRAVRGVDVQSANGGGTGGRFDVGDTLAFTYSTQMNLNSISAGWNGTPLAVNVRLTDSAVGAGSAGDTLDVLRAGTTTALNLGSVNLRGDYIRRNKTAIFSGTMTASTVTVNGLPVTVVQVTVGPSISGGALRTVATTGGGAMGWTPSALATDLAGNPSSVSLVTETGALDREF